MEPLSRQTLRPFFALISLSAVFLLWMPAHSHGGETPAVLPVVVVPTDRLAPPLN